MFSLPISSPGKWVSYPSEGLKTFVDGLYVKGVFSSVNIVA